MKQILFVLMVLPALWIACAKAPESPQDTPTADEAKAAAQIGDVYAGKLMMTLKGTLQNAIQNDGLVAAVDICKIEAIPLTRSAEAEGVEIKRTSFKVRNPLNAPTEVEAAALRVFSAAGKEMPGNHVQKVREGDEIYFYYYRPLIASGLCLSCHGDPQTMPPDLREALAKRYPDDQATGYQEGDFRGVIRIKIPAALLKSHS
jgi:hypothetical protein